MIAPASPTFGSAMELELSAPDEIGVADDYLLAEQTAALEDAQAAAVLEGPEDEINDQVDGSPDESQLLEKIVDDKQQELHDAATLGQVVDQAAAIVQTIAEKSIADSAADTAPESTIPLAVRDFAVDLRDAVLGVQAAQQSYDAANEEYKDAKKSLKSAQARLLRVSVKGIETFPLLDQIAKQIKGEAAAIDGATTANATVTESTKKPRDKPASQSTQGDDWKSVSVNVLVDHGVSQRVLDLLIKCGADTLGKLEAARADTMSGGLKQFKGIGQGKADKIEDAVIGWLSKNRDAGILEDAKEAIERARKDFVGQVVEPAAPSDATPPDNSDVALIAHAAALNTGKKNCLAPQRDDESFWEDGRTAFDRGDKLTDCAWLPGGQQDDWLRGWMAAQLLSKE